jgi:hypothetical protein
MNYPSSGLLQVFGVEIGEGELATQVGEHRIVRIWCSVSGDDLV